MFVVNIESYFYLCKKITPTSFLDRKNQHLEERKKPHRSVVLICVYRTAFRVPLGWRSVVFLQEQFPCINNAQNFTKNKLSTFLRARARACVCVCVWRGHAPLLFLFFLGRARRILISALTRPTRHSLAVHNWLMWFTSPHTSTCGLHSYIYIATESFFPSMLIMAECLSNSILLLCGIYCLVTGYMYLITSCVLSLGKY